VQRWVSQSTGLEASEIQKQDVYLPIDTSLGL
jgi:hypothetical protein